MFLMLRGSSNRLTLEHSCIFSVPGLNCHVEDQQSLIHSLDQWPQAVYGKLSQSKTRADILQSALLQEGSTFTTMTMLGEPLFPDKGNTGHGTKKLKPPQLQLIWEPCQTQPIQEPHQPQPIQETHQPQPIQEQPPSPRDDNQKVSFVSSSKILTNRQSGYSVKIFTGT